MSRFELNDADERRAAQAVLDFDQRSAGLDAQFSPQLIADALPPMGDPLRGIVLSRLVQADMRRLSGKGGKVDLSDYASKFPELLAAELMPRLMVVELELRRAAGEAVDLGSYRSRFPDHYREFLKSADAATLRPSSVPLPAAETLRSSDESTVRSAEVGPATSDSWDGVERRQISDSRNFTPDFYRYDLVRMLGQGQFGEVWHAVAPGGVDVAIKIVPLPRAHRMSQMELRALEVVKRVRHPFLIQVHAYWPMEDQLVVVMELADGSLDARHKECLAAGESGIPVRELVEYMRQAAEALDHLHGSQVVHRDIKPANILLVRAHAKLGDFGVARLFESEKIHSRSTVVGTPQYMAAEVWENQVGPASDQYSLAASYLDLRVGLPESSLSELLSGRSRILRDALRKLPEAERTVVERALDRETQKRYPDCRSFAAALHMATLPEPTKRPSLITWAAAASALAVFGVAAILLSANRSAKPSGGEPTIAPPNIAPPEPEIGMANVFDPVTDSKAHVINGKRYFERVRLRRVAGNPDVSLPLEFALVWQTRPVEDPNPFYIAVDKVTNAAFLAFADTNEDLASSAWRQYEIQESKDGPSDIHLVASDHPELPVMRVTVDDAHRFAKWIHPRARFPNREEWLKAAGYFDRADSTSNESTLRLADRKNHPEGAYRGHWEGTAHRPNVAVGLLQPRPVGVAADDLSLFGCRDMSGNGFELLSKDEAGNDQSIPIENPDYISTNFEILGRGWDKEKPFQFAKAKPGRFPYLNSDNPQTAPLNYDRTTGFRIVMPIPQSGNY